MHKLAIRTFRTRSLRRRSSDNFRNPMNIRSLSRNPPGDKATARDSEVARKATSRARIEVGPEPASCRLATTACRSDRVSRSRRDTRRRNTHRRRNFEHLSCTPASPRRTWWLLSCRPLDDTLGRNDNSNAVPARRCTLP